MSTNTDEKIKRLTRLLSSLDRCIKTRQKFSFAKAVHEYKVNWNPSAVSLFTIVKRVGIIKPISEAKSLNTVYVWTKFSEKYTLEGMANLLLQEINNKENGKEEPIQAGIKNPSYVESEEAEHVEVEEIPNTAMFEHDKDSEGLVFNGFLEKEKSQKKLLPAVIEQPEADLQFDAVEWEIIKLGLECMIDGENKLYGEIAQRIYNKIVA